MSVRLRSGYGGKESSFAPQDLGQMTLFLQVIMAYTNAIENGQAHLIR